MYAQILMKDNKFAYKYMKEQDVQWPMSSEQQFIFVYTVIYF